MKNIKITISLILAALSVILLTGCGNKIESWAYDYEPTQETIAFYKNGKAIYKGEKFDYVKDAEFINLSNSEKSLSLRYVMEGDTMILYEKFAYNAAGDNGDGIKGNWVAENGWIYRFLDNGEFAEEDIFFGHYSVDEENKCIKLMYDDPVPDAYLYYEINGNELIIDYPWPMTATQKS